MYYEGHDGAIRAKHRYKTHKKSFLQNKLGIACRHSPQPFQVLESIGQSYCISTHADAAFLHESHGLSTRHTNHGKLSTLWGNRGEIITNHRDKIQLSKQDGETLQICPSWLLAIPDSSLTEDNETHPWLINRPTDGGPSDQVNATFAQVPKQSRAKTEHTFCHCSAKIQTYGMHPCRGQRVGEASNPGPTQLCICIGNPTSVRDKEKEIEQIFTTHQCNLLILSETSATSLTQKECTFTWKQRGLNTCWSNPVPPQRIRDDGIAAKRGKAGGTAILSNIPCRYAKVEPSPKWLTTSRLLHCIVRVGNMHFQLFAIYGVTQSQPDATATTESLLAEAIRRSKYLHMPMIIAGDFNLSVETCQAFELLKEDGYVHLGGVYQELMGLDYPPTCKESTSPDTAIIHPWLAEHIKFIKVDKSKYFDAHDLVVIKMELPTQQQMQLRYNRPVDWTHMAIPDHLLEDSAKQCCEQTPPPDSLLQWCQESEAIVDGAIRAAHQEQPEIFLTKFLPKKYRGRGKNPKATLRPVGEILRKASDGDYDPPGEITKMYTKKVVVQFRRIQSLHQRLNRVWPEQKIEQFHKECLVEWNAILKNRCLGYPFAQWIQHIPELGPPPRLLPDLHFVDNLRQIFKFFVDDVVYQDIQLRKKHLQWYQHTDAKHQGKRKAFATVKGPSMPVITSIQDQQEDEGIWCQITERQMEYICEIAVGYPSKYVKGFPIKIDDLICDLVEITQFTIVVNSQFKPTVSAETCSVRQQVDFHDTKRVFDELTGYWTTFWSRDADQELSATEIEKFKKLCQNIPGDFPTLDTCEDDIDEWILQIAQTKAHSAPGADGIRITELQKLPRISIERLIHVICHNDVVVPAPMMLGRTLPISKKLNANRPEQCRPITILPQVYRVWGKVVTKRLIQKLSEALPSSITGFLKHRSAHQAAYQYQAWIEMQSFQKKASGGVTLDLIKCYNLVKRAFATHLMRSFQV